MNKYLKNLNRIEFVITLACTGRCKHCSEGDHKNTGESIDKDLAATAVRKIARHYQIQSVMTFGGEALLYPDAVCAIHSAAKEMEIPKRQLITNGYFSKDFEKIHSVSKKLAESGVNDILLSVDAFHQETIPLAYVKAFAEVVKDAGARLRLNPAWLVGRDAPNPYNQRTRELLGEFQLMNLEENDGNVIFPSGNALKNLKEYFDLENADLNPFNPYLEDTEDIRAISFSANGDVLDGNLYRQDICDILSSYEPRA